MDTFIELVFQPFSPHMLRARQRLLPAECRVPSFRKLIGNDIRIGIVLQIEPKLMIKTQYSTSV